MDLQTEQLQHLHAECDCKMLDESHDHTKEPRPPDIEESEEETDSIMIDTNLKLPVTVIVPRFMGMSPQQDIACLGNSLGSVSLPPQQYHSFRNQDLVWLGSSLGTMHKVPVDIVRTSHQVPIRTPSVLSKDILSSSRLGSQTVSECGTDMFTICRICQMPGDEKEPLISPCRCSGSLRYIHFSCLKKWIRISQRRGKKTNNPKCELCHYQFNRHKRFKFSQWRWPRVRRRDKCLHIVFLLNLLIMVGCAIATVMCFLSDRGNAVKFPKEKVKLTTEEVITLTCGVMFFVAFFVAMTVEIKARHTLYKLFLRFITHNTEWTVEPYDPAKDPLFRKKAFSSSV